MASHFNPYTFKADEILLKYIYRFAGYKKSHLPALLKAVRSGDLAMESIVENAVSRCAKSKRTSKLGMDLENGWEVKKVTVSDISPNKRKPWRKAQVNNLKHKTGTLIVVATDPLVKEVFLFKIPHKVYSKCINLSQRNIRGKSIGKICFTFSQYGGKPIRGTRPDSKSTLLWKYQVKSFKELCK